MSWLLLGVGLVLVLEGLVFALMPGRLDALLAAIATLSREQRRVIGLIAIAVGVGLIWIVQG